VTQEKETLSAEDAIWGALYCLKGPHVQDNLHRMGVLGAEDVRRAIRLLEKAKVVKAKGIVGQSR